MDDFKEAHSAESEAEAKARLGLFAAKRAETHPPFRERLSEPGPFPYYGFPRPIVKALHASNAAEAFRACLKRKLRPRPGMHSIRNGYYLTSVEAERHDRSRHCKAIAGFDEPSDEEPKQVGMSRRKELNDAARRKAPRLGDTHNSSVVSPSGNAMIGRVV